MGKTSKRWRRVRIEFEFKSRNFREHGHDPDQCDLIVDDYQTVIQSFGVRCRMLDWSLSQVQEKSTDR